MYIKLGNADSGSYEYDPMVELLSWWETIKKDKHGKHCHNQGKHCFSVCYLCLRHAREGRPSRTCAIESNHGSEIGRTHFARTGLDKWSNRNCGYKIVITYDPRSLTPQSLARQGSGMRPGIGNRVGKSNCVQA